MLADMATVKYTYRREDKLVTCCMFVIATRYYCCVLMLLALCSQEHLDLLQQSGTSRGGKGGVFPGPAMFGGPSRRSKIMKRVFQMASF